VDPPAARAATVLIGVAKLAFVLVALALMDRVGRKPLLLAGCAGMAALLCDRDSEVDKEGREWKHGVVVGALRAVQNTIQTVGNFFADVLTGMAGAVNVIGGIVIVSAFVFEDESKRFIEVGRRHFFSAGVLAFSASAISFFSAAFSVVNCYICLCAAS
jgi:MFS family permease